MLLCESIETLAMAYVDDELAGAEVRELELHVAGCAACRAHVAARWGERAALRRAAAPVPPAAVRARVATALDLEDTVRGREALRQVEIWLLPGFASVAAVVAMMLFVAARAC